MSSSQQKTPPKREPEKKKQTADEGEEKQPTQQKRQQKEAAQPGTAESTHLKLASAGNIDLSQAYGSGRRTQSGKFTLAQLRATEGICPLQNGTNQFDSQKKMTGFGTPRDVKGKHLKRIWELEFPDEAVDYKPPQPINVSTNQQDGKE